MPATRKQVTVALYPIIGSFGTPTNAAIQKYLNARSVPQLFIQAGAARWNDPAHFPWTMPLVNLLRSEAKVYASYLLRTNPEARIAVLYQNDDFGRDYLEGLREKLGAQAHRMIVATASYEATDPTVDSQTPVLGCRHPPHCGRREIRRPGDPKDV